VSIPLVENGASTIFLEFGFKGLEGLGARFLWGVNLQHL
jgi:hypothetical protein